jgi:hypothetical protein
MFSLADEGPVFVSPSCEDGRVPPKRPAKLKSAIAKLHGVARERAIHAEDLVVNQDYSREAADLIAYVVYPFDDDVTTSREFAKEIGSLSMDVAALAETATSGAAVNGAVMALVAFRAAAQAHNEAHYIKRFEQAVSDAASTETKFGA